MNFCPECESILYLNLEKNIETDKNQLYEKCLNCGYKHPTVSITNKSNTSKLCVYNNSISNESHENTNNIQDNKYIIKDMTLPRLGNISCINPKCLTRTNKDSLVIINIDNLDLDKFKTKFSVDTKFTINPLKNQDLLDFNEIHLKNNVFYDFAEVKEHSVLLSISGDIKEYSSLFTEDKLQLNQELSDCLRDFNGKEVYISPISTQVVFIKYDTNNMKYMYICSTCSTSWKNVT